MAHQAHNIPWNLLTSNLTFFSPGTCSCHASNLHPRMLPDQGKELNHFAKAFARNINEHSAHERKKYPEKYDTPDPTDILLDEDCIKKITPTVHRWRRLLDLDTGGTCRNFCGIKDDSEHQCPTIPYQQRTMSSFFQDPPENDCYEFLEINADAVFHLELVKTLILHGEMDPILRACTHPLVGLKDWWEVQQCQCVCEEVGWKRLCKSILIAYISLNVLHDFPKTWDVASGKTKETNYRHTRFYQYMLKNCTEIPVSLDATVYLHRRFFGIGDDQFISVHSPFNHAWERGPKVEGRFPGEEIYPTCRYGVLPIEEFFRLDSSGEYQPNLSDTFSVQHMLCHQGLPVELATEIMAFAKYEPKRSLKVPHNPFHPSNRQELAEHLEYCWKLLVRSDMVGKSLGMEIPWRSMVSECIVKLASSKKCLLKSWWKRPGLMYEFI